MDDRILFIIILIILIDVPIFIWIFKRINQKAAKLNEVIDRQAKKRGGSVQEAKRNFVASGLIIPVENTEALVRYVSQGKNSPIYFIFECDLPLHSQFKLGISQENAFSRLSVKFGGQDIKTHHPDFDKTFRVKGDAEDKIRTILSENIQRTLLDVSDRSVFLTVVKQKFQMNIEAKADSDEEFDYVIDKASVIISKVLKVVT